MKKLLTVLAVAGFAGAAFAQNDTFRFFFAPEGVGEEEARQVNVSNTNPDTVDTAGGSVRYYLYAMYGSATQEFNSVAFDINITGPGAFAGGQMYNHDIAAPSSPTGNRWNTVPAGPTVGSTSWVNTFCFKITEFGIRSFGTGGDTHYASGGSGNGDFGTTLLGFIDVNHTDVNNPGAAKAEIKLAVGSGTIARVGGGNTDNVYFGFGDASTKNKVGRTSANPDGYVSPAPEPASLALLGLGALALRRRR